MLARIFITLLLIITAATTYTQTHNTIIFQPYSAHSRIKADGSKPASAQTKALNKAVLNKLPFERRDDYSLAKQGFMGSFPSLTIKNKDNQIVWSLQNYSFLLADDAPYTVNPSLWRHAQLNMNNGLYQVTNAIYQVRGFDLANMDIIEGKTGIIIIDPLLSAETSKAALALYYQHRPKKPIKAVIFTHSHADHFGGVLGIISAKDVISGKVKVLAPDDFLEHAVSENVYAGNAMNRRAMYMYGHILPRSESGQVDAGLGKTLSLGEITLVAPTDRIKKTGERKNIDGVEMIFQMAPHTEAPAEMLIYFPQFKALCMAEDSTQTMHNLYTLRGATIRDAVAWWKALNESIELFGDKTDVIFFQHTWPVWGQVHLINMLRKQRDLYKFIHDQTLNLINKGYTVNDLENHLNLPSDLADEWFNRGYYGSLSQNAKAIYQFYLGWYDSNPTHLDPLPSVESSQKTVEYMGGASAILAKAQQDYNKGNYRWVAQVLNNLVFADPNNQKARLLEADALEQLGYQTENATWRNEYLTGALELRHGIPKTIMKGPVTPEVLKAIPITMILDYMGIRVNAAKAHDKKMGFNLNFTDNKQRYALILENSVLIYTPNKQVPYADATLNLSRDTLNTILLKQKTIELALQDGSIQIQGDKNKLTEFLALLDDFPPMFNIVTPIASNANTKN
ncbi:MAG: alkyl sulfatase dimerization domain-containing protein [Candidatus Aquirickettsiella sp.]